MLFVGTKKQARDTIKENAEAADMPYVNHRWLGGLLTNFQTISLRIKRLHDLERYETEGQLQLLPTRERMAAQADLEKLRANLGGVKNMQRLPDAVFVIDLKTEAIAVREAQRLRIPIIGLVDTNCDPDGIDYVVPGNDDAIRSCALITRAVGDVVSQGHNVFREEEERARLERERQEAEERARRRPRTSAAGGRGAGPPRGERREAEAASAGSRGASRRRGRRGAGADAAQAAPAPAAAAPAAEAPAARPRRRGSGAAAAEAPRAEPEPAPEPGPRRAPSRRPSRATTRSATGRAGGRRSPRGTRRPPLHRGAGGPAAAEPSRKPPQTTEAAGTGAAGIRGTR